MFHKNSQNGTLLFGAVDKAKYSGNLVSFPLSASGNHNLVLDKLSFDGKDSLDLFTDALPAAIEPSSPYTTMPHWLVQRVGQILSATEPTNNTFSSWIVDCGYATRKASLVFGLSGAEILVPISDLIFEFHGLCYLGIVGQKEGENAVSFGLNFLRNAYVVYDLEDESLSIAQAAFSKKDDVAVVLGLIPGAKSATTSLSWSSFDLESSTLSPIGGSPSLKPVAPLDLDLDSSLGSLDSLDNLGKLGKLDKKKSAAAVSRVSLSIVAGFVVFVAFF